MMAEPSWYRNYSARARHIARLIDTIASPIAGRPGPESRSSTQQGTPRRILLIRPDHAGDLLMATPAIRALKRAHPDAAIDLLASPWGAPALARNPDIAQVLTIEATWFEPGRRDGPDPSALIASLVALRRGHYDVAADLRGDLRSILLARVSGARRRAGFSRLGLEALLTDTTPFDPALDHIGRNHAVVRLLGAGPLETRRPTYVLRDEPARAMRDRLSGLPSARPRIALFPGTNRPGSSWGAERFAAACNALARTRRFALVLAGREADKAAAHRVLALLEPNVDARLDMTGKTDFEGAAALIASVDAVLANDSGAAHLAVAVGTPVVAIFGPTDPGILWTYDEPDRFVALAGPSECDRPCFRDRCANDHGYDAVGPDLVARSLDALVGAAGARPHR